MQTKSYGRKIIQEADIIICGAGLSGCLAAIAAARSGSKTILLERAGMLGGVATTSFMNSMTNFFFLGDDTQVIRGIPGEIMQEGVKRGCISKHWNTNEYRQIRYELEEFHQILLDKLWEANVHIYTHAWATNAIMDGNKVIGVEVQTRNGQKELYSKVVVDATGDLDIIASCDNNSYSYEKKGSATLLFELLNVDMQKTFEFFLNHTENYVETIDVNIPFETFKRNWLERGLFNLPHFCGRAIKPLQDAIERGELKREDGLAINCDAMAMFGTRDSGRMLINSNFFEMDELNSLEDYSIAELSARKICMNLYQTLKKSFPGFENAVLTHIGTRLGSRRIRYLSGKSTVTTLNKEQYDDDVIGVVPVIDKKAKNGFFGDKSIDLPWGAICPKTIDNLLVGTGKSISATWEARHYLRLQPICMLIGQAAGTAASVAIRTERNTQTIDVKSVQKELIQNKAWLGNHNRLNELGIL